MKCVVEVGSSDIMSIPSFIKNVSGIQKLMWWIHRHTARSSHKSTFIFFNNQNKLKRT
jgi:hypothetical protein